MKKLITICVVIVMTGVVSTSLADILVDRGLPVYNSTTPNLNWAAGANRSNVSWAEQDPAYMDGDDFTLPTAASSYHIDTIRTWLIGFAPGTTLGNDYFNVNLYLGSKNGTLSLTSSGNIISNTNTSDNPSISFKPVTYSNGANYQGSGGSFWQIWEVDFSNLNLDYAAGSQLSFAVSGTGNDLWYSHASNAALSNSPQDGADDLFSIWKVADGTLDTAGVNAYTNGLDDKPSDINIQVFGVPEPTTICLLGLGALSLIRRKRNA